MSFVNKIKGWGQRGSDADAASADSDIPMNIDSNGITSMKRAGLFMTDAILRIS